MIRTQEPLVFLVCRDCQDTDEVGNIDKLWPFYEEAQEHQNQTGHKTLVFTEAEK